MSEDVLGQLRDIHLPPDPEVWPLVLTAVALWMFFAMLGAGYWYIRSRSLKARLLRELRELRARFGRHGDTRMLLADLSALLRYAAVQQKGEAAAGLSGARWAEYLRQAAPGCEPWLASLMATDRYAEAPALRDPAVIMQQCLLWIRQACR